MTDRILLVEDDPGSRDLIGSLLAAQGHTFDSAADGFLGLRLLSERRHAIVLIDYHLPEMDGYALARLMREIVGAHGRVRLVGITADRHGLASRRGADALFDAILAKPIEPALLSATLDRLREPEAPPASVTDASTAVADELPAEALWRRRGLAGRPRAVLYPDLGAEAAAALGHAFVLGAVEDADLVLIGADDGLAQLQALPAGSPGHRLPAIALGGPFGQACDATFRVDDPQAWTELARTCRAFAERRAALAPTIRDGDAPACRLLAWLHAGARGLSLAAGMPATALTAGLSRTAAMAAILFLTEHDLVVCEPARDGLVVRLTAAGQAAAAAGLPVAPAAWPGAGPDPIRDPERVRRLREAIGAVEVERLTGNLYARLESAFPPEAERPRLAQEAHALIATAGSLGYTPLEAACRTLEAAVLSGADETAALRRAKLAILDVLATRSAA